jgi:hypothetical protein
VESSDGQACQVVEMSHGLGLGGQGGWRRMPACEGQRSVGESRSLRRR